MSYAESDNEGVDDDDDVFKLAPKAKNLRPTKRRKVSESADEDTYEAEDVAEDGRYTVTISNYWC
jgi:hypothetical protein